MQQFLSLGLMIVPTLVLGESSALHQRQLIVNGHVAPFGRYPYFSTLEHYCGGSLIAPDVILTAGHCMPKHKYDVQPHVGRYTFHHHNNDTSMVVDIRAMDRHENWEAVGEDEMRWDYSLLYLKESILDVPYLQLNRNPNLPWPKQPLVAMGVGWTDPSDWNQDHKANTLREVELNYLPNEQCQWANNSHSVEEDDDDNDDEVTSYQGRLHRDHLCTTGGPNNERDACAYDSGSPIIIQGDSPEQDVLVALVSWGEGCADPDFPAVNARITAALNFIDQSVCQHSANPPPEFGCNNSSSSTEEPTPLTPPTQHGHSLGRAVIVLFLAAALYWLGQRIRSKCQDSNSVSWRPANKDHTDPEYTGETEYLYHSSPTSSSGSKESRSSYNAIEFLTV
ncbi:Tryptase beta-2 [Seminavis robusta]|uniref:Tryptase beta-2 n=1 Tax=Seminavis robusta TaxID=568900 RepID=A0A9N8H9F5_9STRA|nr:Tryptase beta-2 [Seminavis robusta]|eukprot:Sro204_g085910.1 Tryptase beta-2 (394) ;mRNA; f:43116-44505